MQQRCIFDGKITHNSMCQIKSLLLPRGIWPAHRITFSMLAVVFFGAFVAQVYFPKPYKNIHDKIQSISWHKKGNGTLLVNGDRKEWGCWGFWQHWGIRSAQLHTKIHPELMAVYVWDVQIQEVQNSWSELFNQLAQGQDFRLGFFKKKKIKIT